MSVLPHGIILIKGPGLKPDYNIENAHVYDVLPTLLHLLDQPVAEDMDGKVLAAAIRTIS